MPDSVLSHDVARLAAEQFVHCPGECVGYDEYHYGHDRHLERYGQRHFADEYEHRTYNKVVYDVYSESVFRHCGESLAQAFAVYSDLLQRQEHSYGHEHHVGTTECEVQFHVEFR